MTMTSSAETTENPTIPTNQATSTAAPAAGPREEKVLSSRSVERLVAGTATSDGAGVKLTRLLSQPLQRRLD